MSDYAQADGVNIPGIAGFKYLNNRQTRFLGYMLCVLVDLVVLNLFDEFWASIVIDSFLISLFVACLLQVLLKLTIALEHRIANYFKAKEGKGATAMRWFSTWFVLFSSKFAILGILDLAFGDAVTFGGIIPFFVVVIAILVVENVITKISYKLGGE
jgi:hypothetical protein